MQSQPGLSEEAARRQLLARTKTPDYPDPMPPLWEMFPHIERWPSMGWRMGPGEDYFDAYAPWFRALSEEERRAYMSQHPEPKSFEGLYDILAKPR